MKTRDIVILVIIAALSAVIYFEIQSSKEASVDYEAKIDVLSASNDSAAYVIDSVATHNAELSDELTEREFVLTQVINNHNRERTLQTSNRNEIIQNIQDSALVDSFVVAMQRFRSANE